MTCAFTPKSNAHQTRKKSARLTAGALRENLNAQERSFRLSPNAHQLRTRSKTQWPATLARRARL